MPREVSTAEVFAGNNEALREALHTVLIARVVKYDAATQTCDAEPVISRSLSTEAGTTRVKEKLPIIMAVPVQWPRGSGYAIHFPLAPGDYVMLDCLESDHSQWQTTGENSDPQDLRRHSLSHAVARPCGFHDKMALTDVPADEAVFLVPGGGSLRVSKSESTEAQFVALANLVNAHFADLYELFTTTWTPAPNDGGAALKLAFASAFPTGFASVAGTSLKSD